MNAVTSPDRTGFTTVQQLAAELLDPSGDDVSRNAARERFRVQLASDPALLVAAEKLLATVPNGAATSATEVGSYGWATTSPVGFAQFAAAAAGAGAGAAY